MELMSKAGVTCLVVSVLPEAGAGLFFLHEDSKAITTRQLNRYLFIIIGF
jgi:hypothetical protein